MKPREFSPRGTITSALVIAALIAWSYLRQPVHPHVVFAGETMGTYYEVKLPNAQLKTRAMRKMDQEIRDILEQVNLSMSTYLAESEISAFNQSRSTAPQTVSAEFASLVRESIALHQATAGAFDPTVLPIIHAWGFNNSTHAPAAPGAEALAAARAKTGVSHLSAPSERTVQKAIPGLQLDLGAIAKGYAVDAVAEFLASQVRSNYYVNIGGEVRAHGHSTNATPWRIAIETPEANSQQRLYEIVELDHHAMATSGDYRNYYVGKDGQHYAHILDPTTGRPVTHNLASVSVIAPTCMEADALATAIFVMGPSQGLEWVESHEGIEAYFILRDGTNGFKHAATDGFEALIATPRGTN